MLLPTDYAPAERQDSKQIHDEARLIPKQLKSAFDALPYIAFIINNSRQLLFGNSALLQALGIRNLDKALGARPGEIMQCIHATETDQGCGTSKDCRYCGVLNVVLQSQKELTRVTGECRITSIHNGISVPFDLRATCSPFQFESEHFFLVFLEDISAEKRKQQLERTFFHDIINSCGGLLNLAKYYNILQTEDQRELFCENIYRQSQILMEEIMAQRDLLAAENNILETSFEKVDATGLLNDAIVAIELHPSAEGQHIELDSCEDNLIIETDARLVRRVLLNLLKNAVEAPNDGGKVRVGCKTAGQDAILWVGNPAVMAEEVRSQVFQRSFSTKGTGRGIGTYSIKLLVEVYLHGSVTFESSPDKGTVFCVRLPLRYR